MIGQEPIEKPELEYDGFSYVDFGSGEEHSYFSVVYKLSPKLHTQLRGFYDTYRAYNVFDVSYRVKWNSTKKLYLFSGVGVQTQQTKGIIDLPIMPLRMLNGMGYDPKKNISIEAAHDLNFSKNSGGFAPSLFSVSGKYRF